MDAELYLGPWNFDLLGYSRPEIETRARTVVGVIFAPEGA